MNTKCTVCDKTVYDQERQSYDNRHWHLACFKCLSCKRRIDVKSVAMIKGDLYCKPCFLKVFKEKGSYASFGVKTLPNWKPGQDAAVSDGGVGSPTTPPPDAAAQHDAAPAANSEAKESAAAPKVLKPAADQPASAPSGVNFCSSDLPNPKCKVCVKTVYDQEKQVYDKTVWHIACFKCLSCKRRIDVKAVAMIQGDLYCKACFLKVFKEKGSYASFGPKTLPKWQGGADASGGTGSGSDPTTPVTPATPVDSSVDASPPAAIAESPAEAAAEAATEAT